MRKGGVPWSALFVLTIVSYHFGAGCGTSTGPDGTSDSEQADVSEGTGDTGGSAATSVMTTGTDTGGATDTGGPGGVCSEWSDWECSRFGSACRATCAEDATLDVLCNPWGSCIFKTGTTSSGSCQEGEPFMDESDCGFCKAAVAAGCY